MLVFLFTICNLFGAHATKLEQIHDDKLLKLIKVEEYVIVLFISNDCPDCHIYEKKLAEVVNFHDDLPFLKSIRIFKAVNSQLLQLYSNAKEPVILFFRHGLPLMYDSTDLTPDKENEDIIAMFEENKAPTVKELTDDTFEHLTQASTGATTGDWFIMFYSTDCVECLRMMAKWETVGAKLKHRVNVALVNKATTGISTAKRFNVYNTPQFILFRHGKMYRYETTTYDIAFFISFAKEWYKNIRPEEVPPLPSLFDEYAKLIVAFLYDNPWILKLVSICIGVLVIVLATTKCMKVDETPEEKED
ncbi:hypothetical protein PUN28_001624 [Cardiocondyla obscurior]